MKILLAIAAIFGTWVLKTIAQFNFKIATAIFLVLGAIIWYL